MTNKTKIKRTAKWHKKLTIAELRHIHDTTDSGTLAQFKRNRKAHIKHAKESKKELCWECRNISVKLGLEFPLRLLVTGKAS